jgi:hypothetical protein
MGRVILLVATLSVPLLATALPQRDAVAATAQLGLKLERDRSLPVVVIDSIEYPTND